MAKKITTAAPEAAVTPESKFFIIARVNRPLENKQKSGWNLGISPLSEKSIVTKQLSVVEQMLADEIAAGNGAGTIGASPFDDFTKVYSNLPEVMEKMQTLKAGMLCTFVCTQKPNRYFSPQKNKWIDDYNLFCSAIIDVPTLDIAKQKLKLYIEKRVTRRFIPTEAPKRNSEEIVQTPYESAIADAF